MSNSSEQMQVEFHHKAKETFFSLFTAFEDASSKVNRNKNEYDFQQLKKQYVLTLERELQAAGRAVLSKYQSNGQLGAIDQIFHQLIKDYLHRFNQKINAF